jgi:hypothetical protein
MVGHPTLAGGSNGAFALQVPFEGSLGPSKGWKRGTAFDAWERLVLERVACPSGAKQGNAGRPLYPSPFDAQRPPSV